MTIETAGYNPGTILRGQAPVQWDVVIIGAGVAGASAANWCVKAGLRTLLVDQQAFPRDKVCGCCLNGRAVELLVRQGMRERLDACQPIPLSRMHVHFGGRSVTLPVNHSIALSRRSLDLEMVRAAVDQGCVFLDQTSAVILPDQTAMPPIDSKRCVELRTALETQSEVDRSDSSMNIDPASQIVQADVVLVCDGLNHASMKHFSEIHSRVVSNSRIGLGAILPCTAADSWYQPGEVQMGVSSEGYVGIVGVEKNQLNIAAAVDSEFLQQHRSPKEALIQLFAQARIPAPVGLTQAHVRGTPRLTRRTSPKSLPRVFMLGDAAGYVEPFTGEGMAWALSAAAAVVPLVVRAVRNGWTSDLGPQWELEYHRSVGRHQWACRMLASGLRCSWLLNPLMTAARCLPWITHAVISGIDRPLKTFGKSESRPC